MNKFHFIGSVFLLFAALVPLLCAWSWLSFSRLKRRGKTEELLARVAISRSSEQARQVRLVVEMKDDFGDPIELHSRMSCKDWVVHDNTPVTVVYDPADPLGGWIVHDYRRRQKVCLIIGPLFLLIGGALFLFGGPLA